MREILCFCFKEKASHKPVGEKSREGRKRGGRRGERKAGMGRVPRFVVLFFVFLIPDLRQA